MKEVKTICAILGMSLVDVLKCVCQATILLWYKYCTVIVTVSLMHTIHLCNQSGAGVQAFTLAGWTCQLGVL